MPYLTLATAKRALPKLGYFWYIELEPVVDLVPRSLQTPDRPGSATYQAKSPPSFLSFWSTVSNHARSIFPGRIESPNPIPSCTWHRFSLSLSGGQIRQEGHVVHVLRRQLRCPISTSTLQIEFFVFLRSLSFQLSGKGDERHRSRSIVHTA